MSSHAEDSSAVEYVKISFDDHTIDLEKKNAQLLQNLDDKEKELQEIKRNSLQWQKHGNQMENKLRATLNQAEKCQTSKMSHQENSAKIESMSSHANDPVALEYVSISFDDHTIDLEKKNAQLLQNLDDKEKQLQETKRSSLQWQKHGNQMEKELETTLKEADKKTKEVQALNDKLANLRRLVSSLESKLQESQIENEKKGDKIAAIEAQLASMKHHRPIKPFTPSQSAVQWSTGVAAIPFDHQHVHHQIISFGNKVYLSMFDARRSTRATFVFIYDLGYQNWIEMEEPIPKSECSIVFVDDMLTAVGGSNTHILTKLTDWEVIFPSMKTERTFPSCAYSEHYLVVAGGEHKGKPVLKTEILNTCKRSRRWQTIRETPQNLTKMHLHMVGQKVYLFGGYDGKLVNAKVYEFVIGSSKSWNEVTEVPQQGVTGICAAYGDQIFVFGRYKKKFFDELIYSYNTRSKAWDNLGNLVHQLKEGMATVAVLGRQRCFVVISGQSVDIGLF